MKKPVPASLDHPKSDLFSFPKCVRVHDAPDLCMSLPPRPRSPMKLSEFKASLGNTAPKLGSCNISGHDLSVLDKKQAQSDTTNCLTKPRSQLKYSNSFQSSSKALSCPPNIKCEISDELLALLDPKTPDSLLSCPEE